MCLIVKWNFKLAHPNDLISLLEISTAWEKKNHVSSHKKKNTHFLVNTEGNDTVKLRGLRH